MNTQNNVSSRVAMDSFKFERRPPLILQNGRYTSANLKRNDGFALFRYRPRENATTLFNVLACGICSVKLKIRAPGYCLVRAIDFFLFLIQFQFIFNEIFNQFGIYLG